MGSIVKEKRNIIGLLTRQDGDDRFVYTCTRCGSEFSTATNLETHFQVHNDSRRFGSPDRMEVRDIRFSTQSTSQMHP